MKKSALEKSGLNRLWEVLVIVCIITLGFNVVLYLLDRFSIIEDKYWFLRLLIIAVLSILFYPPFYSKKILLRFRYFGSIYFIYSLSFFLSVSSILYFDKELKPDYIEYQIQSEIEQNQALLAGRNRSLNIESSYKAIKKGVEQDVDSKILIKSQPISLIIGLFFCYIFAYFFTFKSFSEMNSYSNN